MSLKVAGIQHQAPVALGTVDYSPVVHGTQSQFVFSSDAVLALFAGAGARNNSTPTTGANFMLGASDGTTSFVERLSGADAVTTSAWRTHIASAKAAGFISSAGAELSYATASLIGSGAQLNWADIDVANRVGSVIFGGAGFEAQVINTAFVGGGAETLTITHAMSRPPDLVIAVLNGGAVNTFVALGRSSVSFYARSAGTYVCVATTRFDSSATENALQQISTSIGGGQFNAGGTFDWTFTYGNFTATTFDVVTNANAGTDAVSFILMAGPNFEVKTGVIDLPANTIQFQAVSGLTKRPKVMLTLPTMMTGVNATSFSDSAGWQGFGAVWENNGAPESFCFGMGTDDAATGTNALTNKSLTAGLLIQTLNPAGAVSALVGGVPTFRSDGLDIALTTADTLVRKLPYVTIGDTAPAPSVTAVTPLTPGAAFTITGTNLLGATATVGGVTQPVTSSTAITMVCTAVLGSNRYLTDADLIVSGPAGASDPVAVQFLVEPTLAMANFVSPVIDATDRMSANPDVEGGDQAVWNDLTVSMTSDGTYNTTNPLPRSMKTREHDGIDWSATSDPATWATITFDIQIPVVILPVPSVLGLNLADATAALIAAQLILGTKTSDYSDTVAIDLVFAQSPIAGALVAQGSGVDISISLGPRPLVPAVTLKARPKTTGLRRFLLG